MQEQKTKQARDLEERRAELNARLDKAMREYPVSVMPESHFVCPFDVTEFIADSLIAASLLPSHTAAWADRKADIKKSHLRALLEKIKTGEIKAFDVNGAVISEYESGFTIRRTDAVAYAANIGVVFAEKPPIDTAPEQEAATPAPVAGKKWTPERLAELKAHREKHTMPETVVKFGISEQRIRKLLPRQKPKAKPFAGLIYRMK